MSAKADGGLLVFRKAHLSSSYCFVFLVFCSKHQWKKPCRISSVLDRNTTYRHFGDNNNQSTDMKHFHARTIKFSVYMLINGALATKPLTLSFKVTMTGNWKQNVILT